MPLGALHQNPSGNLFVSPYSAATALQMAATGAATIKDMGKVMGIVKGKAAGRADMGAVGARVKALLGG